MFFAFCADVAECVSVCLLEQFVCLRFFLHPSEEEAEK